MRKIILGLVATAAIASPLALATAANADSVSTDSTCTPVAAKPATTKTVYKYTPLKSSDGPTQWDTVNAAPNTVKTWDVKGKPVSYFRDGTKTSTVDVPAVPAVVCPPSATGDVTWDASHLYEGLTGTVKFDADVNGGSLDYTNSYGSYLHGVVTPGTYQQVGNTATFDGTFTDGSANFVQHGDGTDYFHAKIVDGGTSGDKIVVFVNEDAYDVWADVTGGDLVIH